ncbi:MAG TPA: hypothetical protein VMX17_04895 [Candidatus Glassbacteria bacterium]|nr:hypothetical protein [Candidatus Glassbacteria bacterium]
MPVKIISMDSWLDEMLGDIKYESDSKAGKLYPFFCRVGCIKRRPARHEFFSMFLNVGQAWIDLVLNHKKLGMSHLSFVFPERWMGQAERRAFTHCLAKHPEVKGVKQLDMITSDPMLIGSFMREQIRIITWPEDEGLYDGADSS